MPNLKIALVAALALAAPGCVVHGHHGHLSAEVGVGVCHHHYLFYPDYDAYSCGSCGHWWVHDGGAWVTLSVRPAHIVLHPSIVTIRVSERGEKPWVHREAHLKKAPPGWSRGKGRGKD